MRGPQLLPARAPGSEAEADPEAGDGMTITESATRGIVGAVDYRPVASYARISKRRKGDGGGAYVKIEKQHEDNTEYIHRVFPGAPVAYYDDNLSAWDPNKTRPEWERMLSDIAAGNVRACVAWHADRYTRQPSQLETLWESCKATGTQYHTVRGGLVTNPLMLRIEGALAANDSDLKSEKISRRHKTLAEEGKPHGGRRRLGYEKGMTELRTVEADAIRDACHQFLAGESLYALANELAEKGITGTSGAVITGPNLRKILGAPHIAGLRIHATTGKTYPGTWPAIITEEDHYAIVHRLQDPTRKTTTGNARVHVLAGLMVCDECGAALRGRPLWKGDGRAYACSTGRHCHRPTELVEGVVNRLVVKRLQKMDASGVFVDDEAVEKAGRLELDVEALVKRRESATDRWAAGEVEDAAHDRNMAALDKREAELRKALTEARAAIRPLAPLEGMTGAEAEARWEAATMDRKRAVIGILFESLSLVGAQHGREEFKPGHVRYVWRNVPGSA